MELDELIKLNDRYIELTKEIETLKEEKSALWKVIERYCNHPEVFRYNHIVVGIHFHYCSICGKPIMKAEDNE